MSKLKSKISKFPQTPGVYVFYGKKREIIYIGKATKLKSRVSSYFRFPTDANLRITNRPIEAMIHEVVDIKTLETDSVLEALILESNLIKKYQPKYNALGKDDKSFSYFVITKEKFPRVMTFRETDLRYKNVIPSLSRDLKKKILDSSTPSRQGRYSAQNDISISKIFGPYTSKKQMEIALKIIRKIFPFHSNKQQTEKGCLDFQIGSCPGPYAGAITAEDYKKNIRGIRMILEGKKKKLVKKMEREMKESSKKYEYEKAGELRNKVFALKHIRDVALITNEQPHPNLPLRKGKGDLEKIFRIEAYDISNISGQHATGSMVVFNNSEPDKSQYRKFKIKTVQGADDIGMMREVLLRRFKNDWPQPDLIFLDGGKGHVNMGTKILRELGFTMPLVAVAKGKSRKNLNFQFSIFPAMSGSRQGGDNQFSMTQFSNEIKNILNDKKLVKRIMDEAHRFALRYHRKLRKNNLLA